MAFQTLKELERIENFIFTLGHEGSTVFHNFRRHNTNLKVRRVRNQEVP